MNHWLLSPCVFSPLCPQVVRGTKYQDLENGHGKNQHVSGIYQDVTGTKGEGKGKTKSEWWPIGYLSQVQDGASSELASCHAPAPTSDKKNQPSDQDYSGIVQKVQPKSSWQGMIWKKKDPRSKNQKKGNQY